MNGRSNSGRHWHRYWHSRTDRPRSWSRRNGTRAGGRSGRWHHRRHGHLGHVAGGIPRHLRWVALRHRIPLWVARHLRWVALWLRRIALRIPWHLLRVALRGGIARWIPRHLRWVALRLRITLRITRHLRRVARRWRITRRQRLSGTGVRWRRRVLRSSWLRGIHDEGLFRLKQDGHAAPFIGWQLSKSNENQNPASLPTVKVTLAILATDRALSTSITRS